MQIPTIKTPVSKCIELGLYAQAMLAKFPANPALTALSAKMGAAATALSAAQSEYAAAILALIAPRVDVKFADYSSDTVVRQTMRSAETADGGKNGKIARAVFPAGVTPIVRPVGATQVTEMRALEGRLEAAMTLWPGAAAEKGKVMEERVKYESALTARRTAMEKAADLRAKRDAAREDFLDVYAAAAGEVKSEFPRNRQMQDLFFDTVSDAASAADGTNAADDGEPMPIAPQPSGGASPPGASPGPGAPA
jgi:hypothetical protein